MPTPISIELFRDIETPCADPSIALPAINYINRLTGDSLQLVDGSKELQISRRYMPTVIANHTADLITSETDIRLVVTQRDIEIDGNPKALGFSMRNPQKGGGFAVISTFKMIPETATIATAHEIGHLYGLRYADQHDDHHCEDTSCLMHARTQHNEYVSETFAHQSIENQLFCTPCGKQLARRALFMMRYRDGLYVPKDLR